MPERIVIEFSDEEDKSRKEQERIIIDLDTEKKRIEIEDIEQSHEEIILKSKVNSCYRGNPHLSNSFETDIKFPAGIEQGFRKKFSLNIQDEFFNSILENNRFVVLSSKNGNVYLIDRFNGAIKDKIFFEYESFEKTGLVYFNIIYLNSLKKIIRVDYKTDGKAESEDVYDSPKDYFIWSNLNRFSDFIIFTEFNLSDKKVNLKVINSNNYGEVYEFKFETEDYVSDKICIADGCAYLLFDSSILVYDLTKLTGTTYPVEIKTDENSFIFYLNYRLYITSNLNELYYIDLPSENFKIKNSGIKNNYINSIGGFGDNIFAGTLEGWKYYKASGLQIYSFEDEDENKIECISKNVLGISKKNKIVFCNLNRFQEAEGYVISTKGKEESIEIISTVFSKNVIFVLTKNGILEAFTNDKLNIHI